MSDLGKASLPVIWVRRTQISVRRTQMRNRIYRMTAMTHRAQSRGAGPAQHRAALGRWRAAHPRPQAEPDPRPDRRRGDRGGRPGRDRRASRCAGWPPSWASARCRCTGTCPARRSCSPSCSTRSATPARRSRAPRRRTGASVVETAARGSYRLYLPHPWLLQVNWTRPVLGPNIAGRHRAVHGRARRARPDRPGADLGHDAWSTATSSAAPGSGSSTRRWWTRRGCPTRSSGRSSTRS